MTLRRLFFSFLIPSAFLTAQLSAHCQMPCGIYHDQLVYDRVDQYYETMYKGCSVLTESKFSTPFERNQYIRWVFTKDKMSDETAQLLMTYFLQQKIKPDEEDNEDLVKSIHRLLFLLVQIKQNTEVKFVKQFGDEWENFKNLFHPELVCRPPTAEEIKNAAKKDADAKHDHSEDEEHDHDHDHPHTHDYSNMHPD